MPQTTPYTVAEVTDIRRFCGFPAKSAGGVFFAVEIGATLELATGLQTDAEQVVVRTAYLAVLPGLESAMALAGANMGTDMASVWTRNRSEVADRAGMFSRKRRELCSFIGVQPGPGLNGGGRVSRT